MSASSPVRARGIGEAGRHLAVLRGLTLLQTDQQPGDPVELVAQLLAVLVELAIAGAGLATAPAG